MSRAFRISCSEKRTETVHVDDAICTALEIIEVLPKEEMAELLAKELQERGFERDGRSMKKLVGEVVIEVDLVEGTVSARASAKKVVDAEGSAVRLVDADSPEAQARVRALALGQIDQQIESERGRMTDALAERLERALRDVKNDLDRAASRATAAGLKIKASKLGDIEEVIEDPESGSITIRVRV